MLSMLDFLHDFLASDWDLSTHGVLGRDHILRQTVKHGLVASLRERFAEGWCSLDQLRGFGQKVTICKHSYC